ncbi:transposase [Ktedonospora formicarum]|uniref:Transposase IS4-like domain-containing protein n=1 Tax=Ktedonospora formicarum TaxID=2778364 RepID=A0A8J3ICI7_9CHLR|nr:transposase [Ktedonospora formicarum]GHO48894.1 hypothetical protein KSX_70570 [Ktedonospora formicarum]
MLKQYDTKAVASQEIAIASEAVALRLKALLAPLLAVLDQQIDLRLVRTFLSTIAIILTFRNQRQGLLLSELGAFLTSPAHAPAGTKRLSNLLRSKKWDAHLIESFLWRRADTQLDALEQQHERALCIWDGSVLEKAESQSIEGLSPVRSSKARRLRRVRPGVYNQMSGPPIVVRGLEWTGVLLAGIRTLPTVVSMQWWSRRGAQATTQHEVETSLLEWLAGAWGERVLHVFDRGYASRTWLAALQEAEVRFLIRWKKGHVVRDGAGQECKIWQLIRGKRAQHHRLIWDTRAQALRPYGLNIVPMRHPGYACPLWLVVARPGNGREPWYLVTNEPVVTFEQGWQLVFAYARRWQIELTFRYNKCELGMESPRVWKGENRHKLLLMVTLAYVFLLSLMHPFLFDLRQWLLRHWCHRTGKRYRQVAVPLYRLRWAISALWQASDPRPFFFIPQNSG